MEIARDTGKNTIRIATLVRRVPLFSHLAEPQLRTLSQLFVPARVKAGQVIHLQGSPVDNFIVVGTGELCMLRRSREGRERIVGILRPGTHFGLAEMITGAGAAGTLRAEKDSTLAVLNNAAFRREVLANPTLCFALMQTMARSIFRLVRELESATFESVSQRLIRVLLALSTSQGVASQRGVEIFNAPTHQDLANLIGSSRETVTRALARMKEQGLIDIGYRRLTILNREGLAELREKTE